MPKFILAYHGGAMPDTPEESEKEMARWGAWMEANADKMTDPGNPVGKSSTLSADGVTEDGGSNPLSGYSIVRAADKAEAIEIARGCPHLAHGQIEIAEIIEM